MTFERLLRAGIHRTDVIRVRPYFGRSMGEHEGDFPVRRFVRVVRGHRGRRRADGAASVHVDKFVIDGVLQNDPVAVEVVADGLGDVVLLALQDALLGR